MPYQFWLAMGIVIGALIMFFVTVIYTVLSGIGREGERRMLLAEAMRRLQGAAERMGLIRREARHLVAVDREAEKIRSGR